MAQRDRDRDEERRHGEESGLKGGSAEAYMASRAYPVAEPLAVPVGWVHWSATLAGGVIALATVILLNALGVGIGLVLTRAGYGGGLAYWMIGASAIGLFLGSYLAARAGQVRSLWTGILYGMVVWALVLLLDVAGLDLYGGLSRFFFAAGVNETAAGNLRDLTMSSGMWFFVAYLIGLAAAVLGGASGVTVEETEHHPRREEHT